MANTIVCQSCQKENPVDAAVCQECGEPLPRLLPELSTERVPQRAAPETVSVPPPAVEVRELRGKGVVLVVRGHPEPILVQGHDLVLGRYDPGSNQPTVDLTPYNAGGLGVSRRHARLVAQDDIYLIEDMGSTNGTWINQQRLPAGKQHGLQNGDVLQLGQLVLNIFFDAATAMRSVEERISFKMGAAKLTPHFLSTRISPYVTALAGVQALCDEMLRRDPSPIELSRISMDGSGIMTIQISGAREALKLAKGPLKTWRKDNATKINQFLTLKEAIDKRTGLLLGDEGEPAGLPQGNEDVARKVGLELREGEIKLAFDFLREIAPNHSGDDRKEYVERLLKHLHVLAFSPLYVTIGSNSLAH
jgi:hypothetical protein